MTRPIVLASGSAIRAQILRGAGVPFTVVRPQVDESAIKRACLAQGLDAGEIALRLAAAKAEAGEALAPKDALVIGADQILECDGALYDKPASMAEARERLAVLSGRSHSLINAVVLRGGGGERFRHLERPRLFMRALAASEIEAYLAAAGPDILSSVGAYQVEGLGARLFERIEGDYFAVLGLSLFALLAHLRREEALDF